MSSVFPFMKRNIFVALIAFYLHCAPLALVTNEVMRLQLEKQETVGMNISQA